MDNIELEDTMSITEALVSSVKKETLLKILVIISELEKKGEDYEELKKIIKALLDE